jgi:hypothetical protein
MIMVAAVHVIVKSNILSSSFFFKKKKIGDQPSDIEKQIRGLVMDFISNPNR